jgi:dolichyl-phosphate-mannose-protein mannosyltransferase
VILSRQGARARAAVLRPPVASQRARIARGRASGQLLVMRVACSPRAPLIVLTAVVAFSTLERTLWIGHPHRLIWDEQDYVNAARRILGLPVPAGGGYDVSPSGLDPQPEDPPLAHLLIAGSIFLFGDNPVGWRLSPILFGTIALLAMYHLVRAAGGSRWLGAGAVAVMAADNLFFVQSRIPTPDIFALTFMLLGVAVYLHGRPGTAGLLLGLGAACKLVGFYALLVLILLEALRLWLPSRSDRPRPQAVSVLVGLGVAAAGCAAAFVAVLSVCDPLFGLITNPFAHIAYMMRFDLQSGPFYAAAHAIWAHGLNSSAWDWLINSKALNYFTAYSTVHPGRIAIAFRGEMNPLIIFLALPALVVATIEAWRARDPVAMLIIAWFAGTFIPFIPGSFVHANFIYFMLIVMPAVYLGVARLLSGRYLPWWVSVAYVPLLLYGAWSLYPFKTWAGG